MKSKIITLMVEFLMECFYRSFFVCFPSWFVTLYVRDRLLMETYAYLIALLSVAWVGLRGFIALLETYSEGKQGTTAADENAISLEKYGDFEKVGKLAAYN